MVSHSGSVLKVMVLPEKCCFRNSFNRL